MKKVLVEAQLSDAQRKQFLDLSDKYLFVFGNDDYDADIIVGDIPPVEVKKFCHVELILSTWVGYDAYIKKGVLNDNTIFCNAVDVHTEEVGQHMFVTFLSMVKKLHLYRDNQRNNQWLDRGKVKSINDLTIVVLGLGNIGKYLAKQCKALGMYVIGVKRNIAEKPEYVDELTTLDHVDEILPRVDAVLNVLPSNPTTKHFFTYERFKLMRPDALLINAGRGDLIDTEVLKKVLDDKLIAGIGQDVYEKEPIPQDSDLWQYENLVITPHVAGFLHLDLARQKFVDLSIENLIRYYNNEPLLNIVTDREK